jgi:hypothetical protein
MNEELIKKFINGPLQRYLTGDISYGKYIELINEECGTNFRYSDLYPSYLFNQTLKDVEPTEYVTKTYDRNVNLECHQYGLCVSHPEDLDKQPFCVTCEICPRMKSNP